MEEKKIASKEEQLEELLENLPNEIQHEIRKPNCTDQNINMVINQGKETLKKVLDTIPYHNEMVDNITVVGTRIQIEGRDGNNRKIVIDFDVDYLPNMDKGFGMVVKKSTETPDKVADYDEELYNINATYLEDGISCYTTEVKGNRSYKDNHITSSYAVAKANKVKYNSNGEVVSEVSRELSYADDTPSVDLFSVACRESEKTLSSFDYSRVENLIGTITYDSDHPELVNSNKIY